jgi:hypothetical protein
MENNVLQSRRSSEIDQLTAAVIQAQIDLEQEEPITKDSKGRFFYASLPALIKGVKGAYLRHGIRIKHGFMPLPDGRNMISVQLIHCSGQFEEDFFMLPAFDATLLMENHKNPNEVIGSSITYFRRYLLKAVLNIEAENEDKDGAMPATEKQIQYLKTLVKSAEVEQAILRTYRLKSLDEIDSQTCSELIQTLKSKTK